jgi:two-component system, NarL family, response regulator DevR
MNVDLVDARSGVDTVDTADLEPVDGASRRDRVRVFLVDDHVVVRAGVRVLLEASGEVEVVGESGTVADAVHRIAATGPDVAVIDVRLPDGSGTELCAVVRERHPSIACLILTSFADDEALFESIRSGAAGFLLKQVRADGLLEAVVKVAAGESLVDSTVTARLLDRVRNPQPATDPRLELLTPLERSVLRLVADGLTNRQIAPQVHLSESTVKNYVSSILHKLGVSRRTEAAVFALRSGEFED